MALNSTIPRWSKRDEVPQPESTQSCKLAGSRKDGTFQASVAPGGMLIRHGSAGYSPVVIGCDASTHGIMAKAMAKGIWHA